MPKGRTSASTIALCAVQEVVLLRCLRTLHRRSIPGTFKPTISSRALWPVSQRDQHSGRTTRQTPPRLPGKREKWQRHVRRRASRLRSQAQNDRGLSSRCQATNQVLDHRSLIGDRGLAILETMKRVSVDCFDGTKLLSALQHVGGVTIQRSMCRAVESCYDRTQFTQAISNSGLLLLQCEHPLQVWVPLSTRTQSQRRCSILRVNYGEFYPTRRVCTVDEVETGDSSGVGVVWSSGTGDVDPGEVQTRRPVAYAADATVVATRGVTTRTSRHARRATHRKCPVSHRSPSTDSPCALPNAPTLLLSRDT